MNLYLGVAVLTLALALAGCAMTPKAERYVAPPPGSTLSWRTTNTGSFGSGTRESTSKITERMWEGKRMIAFVSPTGTLLETQEGAWFAMLGPDDKPIITWDPPASYDWPLEVGKTWTKSYRMTVHPRNQTLPYDSTVKVESYEDMTVPAGTFKVFKVSSSNTIGVENIQWFSPQLGVFVKQIQKRAANSPLGAGTSDQELISQTVTK
jgi:hypothetical protein